MSDRLVDERTQLIWVHSSIDDMTDLSPNAMRVYMHLVRRADAKGVAWPSYQKIGDHCFASVSEKPATRKTFARNAVDELIAAGLIRKEVRIREDGGQSSNAYTLINPSTGVLLSTGGAYKGMAHAKLSTPRAYQAPEDNTNEGNPIEGNPFKEQRRAAPAVQAAPRPHDHPAVQAYRDFHERFPEKAQMKLIIERDPPIAEWVRALRAWSSCGYSPKNVGGMLEWAENPDMMRAKKGGRVNKGQQQIDAVDEAFRILAERGMVFDEG